MPVLIARKIGIYFLSCNKSLVHLSQRWLLFPVSHHVRVVRAASLTGFGLVHATYKRVSGKHFRVATDIFSSSYRYVSS